MKKLLFYIIIFLYLLFPNFSFASALNNHRDDNELPSLDSSRMSEVSHSTMSHHRGDSRSQHLFDSSADREEEITGISESIDPIDTNLLDLDSVDYHTISTTDPNVISTTNPSGQLGEAEENLYNLSNHNSSNDNNNSQNSGTSSTRSTNNGTSNTDHHHREDIQSEHSFEFGNVYSDHADIIIDNINPMNSDNNSTYGLDSLFGNNDDDVSSVTTTTHNTTTTNTAEQVATTGIDLEEVGGGPVPVVENLEGEGEPVVENLEGEGGAVLEVDGLEGEREGRDDNSFTGDLEEGYAYEEEYTAPDHTITTQHESLHNNLSSSNLEETLDQIQEQEERDAIQEITVTTGEKFIPEVHSAFNPIHLMHISDHLNLISNTISFRLEGLANHYGIGVSAGSEEDERQDKLEKGLWAKAIVSDSKQKNTPSTFGYKNHFKGFLIGADSEIIEDKLLLGIAYINSNSHTKFNTYDTPEQGQSKQKTNIHFGALYASYNISSNLSVSSHIKYGRALIKMDETTSFDGTSLFKTHADIFRSKIDLSYSHSLDNNLLLIPQIGLTFDNFKVHNFKFEARMININYKNSNKVSSNINFKIKKFLNIDDFDISTYLSFNIDRRLKMTNGAISILSNEATPKLLAANNTNKISKTTYTIGTGVNISKSKNIEFGIGYDCSLRPKMVSHSYFLSIKMNL